MPFYYSIENTHTTSGTAATEADALRVTTGSSRTAALTRLILGASGAAQDNQVMGKLWRMSVASTVGSSVTAKPRDNSAPAAGTTLNTGPTIGTKETNASLILPFNSRAMVQFVALNPDEALVLAAGGGANGNVDLLDEQAAGAAVAIRYGLTFAE